MRPVIGITTYAEEATWGPWTEPAAFIPLAYVGAVERAGGRPLLVPPVADGVDETLDVLDAIIFSGGGDLDPETYGADAHPETNEVSSERDSAELALLEAALARDMPVLAVCRGSQVLNVARGGDLVQHLPEIVGHDCHRHEHGLMADHRVRVEADPPEALVVRRLDRRGVAEDRPEPRIGLDPHTVIRHQSVLMPMAIVADDFR